MAAKIVEKLEKRVENWKKKAVARNEKIRTLNKRIKEVVNSRNLHRSKWHACRAREKELELEVQELKYQINKNKEQVHRHSYDLQSIVLCLQIKQSGTMSWRTCRAVILTICLYFDIEMQVPSAETIRYWSLKYGCHHIKERKIEEEEYVIIIDESFTVGRQSLLLILGVKLSTYKFESSLSMEDMEVLSIEVKKSWTAADISKKIKGLQDLGYKIVYGCSDGGKNIVNALADRKIERIYDCTHALSLLLKKEYKEAEEFKLFSSKYVLINRQNYMGQDTFICPPKLRGKCRFLNMYPMASWAEDHLDLVRRLAIKERNEMEERIYQKLKWLEDFSDLIDELVQLVKLLKAVFKILKNEGLSEASIEKVHLEVSASKAPLFLRQGIRNWVAANKSLLSKHEKLICCSDIIESFFGKFKYEQTKNPNKGITIGCLNMVNFGQKIDKKEVIKAMEEVRIVDLKKWRDDRNLKSFNYKKQKMLENVG